MQALGIQSGHLVNPCCHFPALHHTWEADCWENPSQLCTLAWLGQTDRQTDVLKPCQSPQLFGLWFDF